MLSHACRSIKYCSTVVGHIRPHGSAADRDRAGAGGLLIIQRVQRAPLLGWDE